MKTAIKEQELSKFITKLKKNGFKVYIPFEKDKEITYCNFVKYDKIGYVECGDHGFNFSTVHRGSKGSGSGYQVHREKGEPTIKMAEDCFVNRPNWANSGDTVDKYKNWEDYLKGSTNRIIDKFEL